jgi:hypothetical protein
MEKKRPLISGGPKGVGLALAETGLNDYRFKKSRKDVSIGTFDPGTRLEVLSSKFDVAKFRTQLNDANLKVESAHGTTAMGYTPDGGYVGTSGAGNFSIKVQNSTRMFFKNSTGYIGINTLGPTEALDVNGNVKANGFKMTTGASNGYILTSDFSGNASWTAPPVIPNHWTMAGNTLYNTNTGYVGIGTSTPTKPLTIKGDTNQDLLQFKNKDDVAKWHWWMPGGTDLVLTESNVEDYRITVKPGGNVGIGKQNPTQRLDVQGNINLSGKIMTSAPVTLSLQSGWVIYDPDFGAPSYYQDKQGIVLLSGLAEYPGGTTGGHVCTLPGGYRPITYVFQCGIR